MFKKLFLFLVSCSFFINSLFGIKMNVVLNDLPKGTKGDLRLVIVNNEKAHKSSSPEKDCVLQFILIDALLKKKEVKFSVDLPAGKYVIQYFIDANKDGKLDTNFIGVPKEQYGFTRKYDAMAKPAFKDVVIELKKEKTVILFTKKKKVG